MSTLLMITPKVYSVKLNKRISAQGFESLMAYVSQEEREKVKKLRKWEDAQRTLIVDILLRYVLGKELNTGNEELSFGTNEHGKPFVRSRDDINFSVSHSGEWIACAVHDLPLGIDIELIQSLDYYSIAKCFFSEDEYNDLTNKNHSKRLSYFYELWTLKESYIKAVGKGLSIPLDSFSIRVNRDDITLETPNEYGNWFFKQYNIDRKYKMAVCATIGDFSDEVIISELDEVCEGVVML